MPQLAFYRYLGSQVEVDLIVRERRIRSSNPHGTWYTTARYDDPTHAQQELALPNPPTHRVGPIAGDEMPDFDVPLRPVAPANGQPGGGVEARTKGTVYLFGVLQFSTGTHHL